MALVMATEDSCLLFYFAYKIEDPLHASNFLWLIDIDTWNSAFSQSLESTYLNSIKKETIELKIQPFTQLTVPFSKTSTKVSSNERRNSQLLKKLCCLLCLQQLAPYTSNSYVIRSRICRRQSRYTAFCHSLLNFALCREIALFKDWVDSARVTYLYEYLMAFLIRNGFK